MAWHLTHLDSWIDTITKLNLEILNGDGGLNCKNKNKRTHPQIVRVELVHLHKSIPVVASPLTLTPTSQLCFLAFDHLFYPQIMWIQECRRSGSN